MRVLADLRDGGIRLYSRNERDVTVAFPELLGLGTTLPDALLDGEVVSLVGGIPSFSALADRMHVRDARRARALAARGPVTVMVFDLLRLYGVDLLHRPLTDRRASLERLDLPEAWQVPPAWEDGEALWRATEEQQLEGIVSKRRASTYQPGRRSPDWIKTAHWRAQVVLVGGWRHEEGPHGPRARIGSLLVGLPDSSGRPGALKFAGRVGSGISAHAAAELARLLEPLRRSESPFVEPLPRADALRAHWCRPTVVVEARHLGWTAGHRLRQPSFRGIRTDVDPAQVSRES